MKYAGRAVVACVAAALVAGCGGSNNGSGTPHNTSTNPNSSSTPALIPGTTISQTTGACGKVPDKDHYFGIIDGAPGSPGYVRFLSQTRVKPTLADIFFNFGSRWYSTAACYAVRHGSLPLIQVNLRHTAPAAIASGQYDSYIRHLAGQIRHFRNPIVISLAHEMNGNWYPWGWTHVPASTYIAMWRHVHNLFAAAKATNVIWMWTVNRAIRPATIPQPWWPGKAYVNWVGIDGHDRHPSDNFHSVFASTMADVRQVTSDPILISESAVVSGAQRPAQLNNLYQTAYSTPGIVGILYLNQLTARIDWRLSDRASLRAFITDVLPFEDSPSS